jgi:predicted Rossmann-fold nucleotide-binding protein
MSGPIHVAVIGPGDARPRHQDLAERVGALLALAGVVVVTGGLAR